MKHQDGDSEAILAVDCGTSSFKVSLIRRCGGAIRLTGVDVKPIPPRAERAQEWNAKGAIGDLAVCLFRGASVAVREGVRIVGLAITSTTSSVVCVNKKRRAALDDPPPMRWDDLQAEDEAHLIEQWRSSVDGFPWLAPVGPDSGIAKALLIATRFPNAWMDTNVSIMEQWTYYNWWLTGQVVRSESIVSRKWGMTESLPWKDAFRQQLAGYLSKSKEPHPHASAGSLGAFDAKALEGKILPGGAKVGLIRQKVSQITGLPTGLPVFVAPYDTCAQVMGIGLCRASNSILGLSLGTSLGVCAIPCNRIHESAGTAPIIPDVPWRGLNMLFDGIASCGSAINYIAARFGAWKDGKPDFDRISQALRDTEPEADSVTMLPYFAGGRRATIATRCPGSIDGLRVGHNESHIIRALFESLAYIVRCIVDDFEDSLGCHFQEVLTGGGPSGNKEFVQMLADVLGRPLNVSRNPDTALAGTALCAAVGLRWFDSLTDASEQLLGKRTRVEPTPRMASDYTKVYDQYVKKYRDQIHRPKA
ncbi:MAG TPA: FGGY-family carbohydrate kinase [Candidatus Hydrogenedentes bacterium]|mgnify:CR=1 FL=1|nr:FGGY-family carbohydrate kinase [Candidatus Hydrogenedentota bacterium]HPG68124.1 FGGY-family carbohydrate kinase [Candidatus Hydrogenedentota bacterium]